MLELPTSQGGHEIEQRDPPGAILFFDLVGHHQEQGHVGSHVLKGMVDKPRGEPPAQITPQWQEEHGKSYG
jgi:hypothetical protein